VICQDGLALLNAALTTAQHDQKQQKQVQWLATMLLRKAPHTAADVTQQLLKWPKAPLHAAKQLA
jgi:hypothetical protein